MSKETRVTEIMSALNACSKERYHKSEVLTELLQLQKEMVGLTFGPDHGAYGDLKLWDVVGYLSQLNEERGNVADAIFQRFKRESGEINNLIRSEISGKVGERKVVERIERMCIAHRCLHNIELMDGSHKSEIDSLVVTAKGIYIVEVKNTQKDIFIDEKGDYYRTGEYLKWDSNIGKKLFYKRLLIEHELQMVGKRVYPIKALVVFTNNRIQVNNRMDSLQTCFLSQLPAILEDETGPDLYREEDMEEIIDIVNRGQSPDYYAMKYNVRQFKEDFATVMATLNTEQESEEVAIQEEVHPVVPKVHIRYVKPKICPPPKKNKVATVIAVVSVGVMFTTMVAKQRLLR